MTKNEVSIEELLENSYKLPISSFDGKYTKTSLFFLNCLDINVYKPLVKKYFVNSFLEDSQYKSDIKRPIFCLFKVADYRDKEWKQIYKLCKNKKEFITDYDCGLHINEEGSIENLVMILFDCPEEFITDYYHFRRGRYSQFSELFKNKIPETIINDNGTKINSLVYKHRVDQVSLRS